MPFMHPVVMMCAEGNQILDIGPTVVFPERDVVSLTPADLDSAAMPSTGVIHRSQRRPLMSGRRAMGAPYSQRNPVAHHNGLDHRIA